MTDEAGLDTERKMNDFDDVWPLPNGYWEEGEQLYIDIDGDGQWDKENEILLNEGIPKDGYQGDPFQDSDNNGKRNGNENYWDRDGNNKYSYPTGEFDG